MSGALVVVLAAAVMVGVGEAVHGGLDWLARRQRAREGDL